MTGRHWHAAHRPTGPLASGAVRVLAYGMSGEAPGRHVGMPSRTLTLVIALDERLALTQPGDRVPQRLRTCIAGLATEPTVIHHDGHWRGVQLDLRPSAARALLGAPASALVGRSHELADVVGPLADRLRDRLHEVTEPRAMFAVVDATLASWWDDRSRARSEVAEAWRVIGAAPRAPTVAGLARHVGWSVRHLEQQFLAEVGLTPSQTLRLRRFERAHALVGDPSRRLADVAVEAGYADQAHLSREWKSFSGLTPRAWRAQELAYVQAVQHEADLASTP